LKLGDDLALLVGVVEGDAQHAGGASVGLDPVDEPADLSLDVGASRQQTHRMVQIQRPERAQLAPDRNT
jgi:hypothetical protein